jgi:hypothetical protein
MRFIPIIERFVYAALIILSLAALLLVLNSPADIVNTRVVYQGF